MIHVLGLDHFVLTVRSIERTAAFYGRVLGMAVETYGAGRTALRLGSIKINLHEDGSAPALRARAPRPGADDFCLEVEGPLADVAAALAAQSVEVEEGPVARNGARGPMISVYVRDPDGNLVELSVYGDGGAPPGSA